MPLSRTAILSIDLGTSSTRARLYDAQTGQPIPGTLSALTHQPTVAADGTSTLDADALVREIAACAEQARAGANVIGVGMACFWHSIVGVDAAGNAVTPVLLWNDRRSAAHVSALKTAQPTLPETTGCPWHTSFVYGRLTWLRETQPALFDRCVRFLSPAAYVYRQLFGVESESPSMASASGLWDQHRQAWLPEWAGLLPPVASEPIVSQGLTWFPPIGDGVASNLGCGAVTPERMALMIGTSGALRVMSPEDVLPPHAEGLWRYQLDSSRFLQGGALSNGGAVWAWLEKTLAPLPHLAAQPPDAHGLTILPFLSGERAPLWRDDLSAAILGHTAATTPEDLAFAHLEAVAYRFAAIRDRLRTIAPHAELIGTGAALKASPLWAQVLADVLGEPILLADEEEGSARGAALWARECLGLGAIADAPRPAILAAFPPNAAHADTYTAARQRQETYLNLLNPTGNQASLA